MRAARCTLHARMHARIQAPGARHQAPGTRERAVTTTTTTGTNGDLESLLFPSVGGGGCGDARWSVRAITIIFLLFFVPC